MIPDENPAHTVTVNSFFIGRTEITQTDWIAFIGSNPSNFNSCGLNCPVESISWYDAMVYCNWLSEQDCLVPAYYSNSSFTDVYGKSGSVWSLPNTAPLFWNQSANGYRLPTEAEWEYAARGGASSNGFKWAGSNTPDDVAWYNANSGGTPHPVAQKQPNELGIYDMSGNVWEYIWDHFSATYYSSSPVNNPTGPASGTSIVRRGAAWIDNARGIRISDRANQSKNNRNVPWGGIRIVRSDLSGNSCCSIDDAGAGNITCDNNGTPGDPSDDTFTSTLNPTGSNLGSGYSVSGDVTACCNSYGSATTFGPFPSKWG